MKLGLLAIFHLQCNSLLSVLRPFKIKILILVVVLVIVNCIYASNIISENKILADVYDTYFLRRLCQIVVFFQNHNVKSILYGIKELDLFYP